MSAAEVIGNRGQPLAAREVRDHRNDTVLLVQFTDGLKVLFVGQEVATSLVDVGFEDEVNECWESVSVGDAEVVTPEEVVNALEAFEIVQRKRDLEFVLNGIADPQEIG